MEVRYRLLGVTPARVQKVESCRRYALSPANAQFARCSHDAGKLAIGHFPQSFHVTPWNKHCVTVAMKLSRQEANGTLVVVQVPDVSGQPR